MGGELDHEGKLMLRAAAWILDALRNGWKGKLSKKWLDLAIFI
jgi:hypothetical protein